MRRKREKSAVVWMNTVVLLLILSAGIFLFALWMIQDALDSYSSSEQVYDELEAVVTLPESDKEEVPELTLPDIDWDALESVNPDVIGWLYCPGTPINYPIVQGGDNQFYLTHLIDGSEGCYGTLFLDCQCSLMGQNSILYGHHMKNGAMLASLTRYQRQEYYDAHPTLYLLQRSRCWEVSVFSGYTSDPNGDAYTLDLSAEEFGGWAEEQLARSDFLSAVAPQSIRRVLTLSTCTYAYDDARYVVLGSMHPYIR